MEPFFPMTWPTTAATEGDYHTPTTNPCVSNNSHIRFNPFLGYTTIYWLRVALFFFVIMGNTLVCIVFSTKHYRGNLHAMLYRIIAVTDTIVIMINDSLDLLPWEITGQNLLAYNSTTCKIIGVLQFWFRALSLWFLVPIALERFIAVWFPFQTVNLNTKGRYSWLILGLGIITFVVYAPLCETIVHFYKMKCGKRRSYCHLFGDTSEHFMWYRVMFDFLNLMVSSIMPFLCIAVLNMAIICGLLKSRSRLPKSFDKAHSEMRSRVMILLLISVSTIVLSLPHPVYFMFLTRSSGLTSGQTRVLGFILPICDSISHSINIVLYCFSGRQFRQNLWQLLGCDHKNASECNKFLN